LYQARRWFRTLGDDPYPPRHRTQSLQIQNESKNNLKDTRMFKNMVQGTALHSLTRLLGALPQVQRAIQLDRTGQYKAAWDTVTSLWHSEALRYWDKRGDQSHSARFIGAVQQLHRFILEHQGESA